MSEAAELLALESAGNTIRFNEGSFLDLAACQGDAETVRLLLARCEDPLSWFSVKWSAARFS